MKAALFLLLFCFSTTISSSIYQWKDAEGNIYFSDTAKNGALKVNVHETQTYTPIPVPKVIKVTSIKNKVKKKTKSYYQSITITDPKQDSTIPNRSGEVVVKIDVVPSLKNTDEIQLSMDGKKIMPSNRRNRFNIHYVNRGMHTLNADIINQKKDHLLSADPITFYVLRPSKLLGPLHKTPPPPKSSRSPVDSLKEVMKKLAPLASLLMM